MATYRPRYIYKMPPTTLKFKPDWPKIAAYVVCLLIGLAFWGLIALYAWEKIR